MTPRQLLLAAGILAGLTGVAVVARKSETAGERLTANADKFVASLKAEQKSTNWPDDSDSGIDTDDEAYVGPKRVKKGKGVPRRSGRAKKTANYDLDAMDLVGEEDHIKDEGEEY